MENPVRAYYERLAAQEWRRLERPDDGVLEWALTCRALTGNLPPTGRVLDIGGGPGRYAIWLAQHGYRVVLADLSPALLEVARARIAESGLSALVEAIVEADARDLSPWADASFDAVLSLGPFYHLPNAADRDRAAREIYRVLRPGGIAFVALMPRYAFLRRTLALADERHRLASPEFVARILTEGTFVNDIPGRFTGGYGFRPAEVAPFFARHGLQPIDLLATEGMIPDLQGALADLSVSDPASYHATLDMIARTANDPAILGLANHLLFIGRRPR